MGIGGLPDGFADWAKAGGNPKADWIIERQEAANVVEAIDAAHSLYLGLTCENDPMDVDERIERLGKALEARRIPTGDLGVHESHPDG